MPTPRVLLGMTLGALVATAGALFLGEYEFDELLPILSGALLGLIVAEVVVSVGRLRNIAIALSAAAWSATAVVLAGILDANETGPIKWGAYLSAGLAALAALVRANRWRKDSEPDTAVAERSVVSTGSEPAGRGEDRHRPGPDRSARPARQGIDAPQRRPRPETAPPPARRRQRAESPPPAPAGRRPRPDGAPRPDQRRPRPETAPAPAGRRRRPAPAPPAGRRGPRPEATARPDPRRPRPEAAPPARTGRRPRPDGAPRPDARGPQPGGTARPPRRRPRPQAQSGDEWARPPARDPSQPPRVTVSTRRRPRNDRDR